MPARSRSTSDSCVGSTVVSDGNTALVFMPSSASPRIAADARYGLADGSTTFTSTFPPYALPAPPLTNRTAASRFSVPQHA